MHIVQVCRLYSPHLGGVETHVLEVSRWFKQQGHSVTVVTTQYDAGLPLTQTIDGIKVLRKPVAIGERKLDTWRWMWTQRQVFESADVVQVHDIFWWLIPLLPLVYQKVFTTFHGWETTFPIRVTAKAQRWLWNRLSQGTVHVGDWIREFYWDQPTVVTYGGINLLKTKQTRPQLQKLRPQTLRLVFLGRLSSENEINVYLQLLKELRRLGQSIEMTWVGDGDWAALCQREGTVIGMIPDPQKYLMGADFVLATSYLSILQAQALGKVVCALYSNELKKRYLETYPGSDYMLIDSSVPGMIKQMSEVQESSSSYQSLQKQAATFAQQQTWDKVAMMYQDLWQI